MSEKTPEIQSIKEGQITYSGTVKGPDGQIFYTSDIIDENQKLMDYFLDSYIVLSTTWINQNTLKLPDSVRTELDNIEEYFKEALGKDIKELLLKKKHY